MASLYKRKGSAFWWIKSRARYGRVRRASTRLKISSPAETRKARLLCAQKAVQEFQRSTRPTDKAKWSAWVEPFLKTAYVNSPKTLQRYQIAWRSLSAYLRAKEVDFPADLTFKVCFDYLDWRKAGDRPRGVHAADHNTAVIELKVLHLIMEHAIRCEFATTNPARKLGIHRRPPPVKPRISEEHLELIWRELATEPEWMRVSFQISLYCGCRLRETMLNLDKDVDWVNHKLLFDKPKGGVDKAFDPPMRNELYNLLWKLKQDGRKMAVEMPALPSKAWWSFFKRIGLPQYCFHCLRVTFISRCCEAGIPENMVMKLVNHASATINRIYQRHRPEDLRAPLEKMAMTRLAQNEVQLTNP